MIWGPALLLDLGRGPAAELDLREHGTEDARVVGALTLAFDTTSAPEGAAARSPGGEQRGPAKISQP